MSLNSNGNNSKSSGLSSSAHRKRYSEVVRVFAKYGFDEFLISPNGQKLSFIHRQKIDQPQYAKLSRPKRIKLAIEELDGAFIKLAQILSNRPDVLPPEYIKEFESLQDNIPPFSTETAIEIIEAELNDKIHRLFFMFDDEALASGSIAQVHRAILFDGTPVVIKIRRPNIEQKFKIDLDVLNYISRHLSKIEFFEYLFQNTNPIKDISTEIMRELDLTNELFNIKKFAKNYEGNEDIYIPKAYSSFSTEKVLTMEYIDGIKVTDTKKFQSLGLSPEVIATKLIDGGFAQVFDFRFFHGDPHPGNILVTKEGKICFIDFGLVGRVTTKQRQTIIDVIFAFSRNDSKKMTRIFVKFIPKNLSVDEDEIENKFSVLLDKYYDANLKEINVGKLFSEVLGLILEYKVSMNFNIYLLIKALSSYEGIGKKIYPEFEIAPTAKSIGEKLIKEQFSPARIAKEAYFSATDAVNLIKDLPSEIKDILNMLQGGRLRFNVNVLDLRQTIDYVFGRVDKIVNRIVMAIILASIIMGSSIILRDTPNIDPKLIYLSAGIGFILALIMGFMMIYSIFRNKGI
jgi:ubiquinone biosynthesis protein